MPDYWGWDKQIVVSLLLCHKLVLAFTYSHIPLNVIGLIHGRCPAGNPAVIQFCGPETVLQDFWPCSLFHH